MYMYTYIHTYIHKLHSLRFLSAREPCPPATRMAIEGRKICKHYNLNITNTTK